MGDSPPKDDLQATQEQAATLFEQGRLNEALECLQALAPHLGHLAYWHYNRALVLTGLRRFDDALKSFGLARAAGMSESELSCQEGVLWQWRGATSEALQCYERALAADPTHALSLLNRGALLLVRKDYASARDALDSARLVQPGAPGLAGACWLARRHLAQWDASTAALASDVVAALQRGEAASEPFTVLALVDDMALQRQAAHLWQLRPQARAQVRAPAPVGAGAKLRIAYFSSDFHDHATMHLLAGVLEAHDRSCVEVLCFSWGPPTRDAYQRRAIAAADAFIEVHDLHDVAVADRARALEIDIAVDLKGATHDARPGIFAARAAPVQVNYLGYPGTLGQPWWDYIVADAVVVPAHQRDACSEKVAQLPHSYQPNDVKRFFPATLPSRTDCGLPDAAVVFACFNAHYKLGPGVFTCWMEILRRVPGAVLWLLAGHPLAQAQLGAQAHAHGVDPVRLVFAPLLPQARHLARLPLADVMLDTWPCNAHTTASDALWMGVPMVTLAGGAFAARVAASTLHGVGLPELVCTDAAQYVDLAVSLASDCARRQALRQHLAHARTHAPLFDTVRYTRSLEAAWWAMVQRQRAGLAPAHFSVQEGDG